LNAGTKLKVTPEECVYVGDGGDNEIAGARGLGMHTVLIERDLPRVKDASLHAARAIRTLNEVVALVS
jgi:putative hydrolase of the HAD superfamily